MKEKPRIVIKTTKNRRERYKKQAHFREKTLSEYIRDLVDQDKIKIDEEKGNVSQ